MEKVSILDVVAALRLDGYFPPENVVQWQSWFQGLVVGLFVFALVWTCCHSIRTFASIAMANDR